jgi:hypothetical protein
MVFTTMTKPTAREVLVWATAELERARITAQFLGENYRQEAERHAEMLEAVCEIVSQCEIKEKVRK